MAKLQIIGPALSNYVWTVRIAAAEKGVDIEHVDAAPGSADVKAINPLAKVPVMRHGDFELYESRREDRAATTVERFCRSRAAWSPDLPGSA